MMNPFKSRNKSIDVSDKDTSFTVYYLGSVPTSFVRSTTSGAVAADLAAASPEVGRAIDALWNTFVSRLRDVGLGPDDLLQSHKTMMMPQHRHQLQHQHRQLMRRGGVATPTRLTVCASGLRAIENTAGRRSKTEEGDENEAPAVVEYRAHRIAHASWHRPATGMIMTGGNSDRNGQRYARRVHFDDLPSLQLRRRLFVWIYRHQVKLMRVEMRCHAVLCKTESAAESITSGLRIRLRSALDEYARERRSRQTRQLGSAASSSTTTSRLHHNNTSRYPNHHVSEAQQLQRANSLPSGKGSGLFEVVRGSGDQHVIAGPNNVLQHRSCIIEVTTSGRRRRIIHDVTGEFPVSSRSMVMTRSSVSGSFDASDLVWTSARNGCQPMRTRLLSVGRHFKPPVSQSLAASKLGVISEHVDEEQFSMSDEEISDDSDDNNKFVLNDNSAAQRQNDELDRAIVKKTLFKRNTNGTLREKRN